jgi:hypothetical protein
MKKLLLATVLVAIVALTGCLSALHPLFTEKDLEFNSQLVGAWGVDGEDAVYTFQRGTPASFGNLPEGLQRLSSNAYTLSISSRATGEETGRYYAFLVRIGKHVYLDYFPEETNMQRGYANFFKMNFVRMHSFYRLSQGADGNSMAIGQFSESYLRKLIDNKQIRIKHETKMDGSYVITAPTEELQQYVLKYGDASDAYQDNKTFTRIH